MQPFLRGINMPLHSVVTLQEKEEIQTGVGAEGRPCSRLRLEMSREQTSSCRPQRHPLEDQNLGYTMAPIPPGDSQ